MEQQKCNDFFSESWDIEKRRIWAATRAVLETDTYKRQKHGKSKRFWRWFNRFLYAVSLVLKVLKLYDRGYANAKNIKLNELTFTFSDLPKDFNGFKILHLTDLHFDTLFGTEDFIIEKIKNIEIDLCVITGDYRKETTGASKMVEMPFRKLSKAINSKYGVLAVLGNHDSYLMHQYIEGVGFRLLANESVDLHLNGSTINITGIDDPHYYYTDQAINAMEESCGDFKIILAHSPELATDAEKNDFRLYFCGHTHGGQICLPGGKPLITHLSDGKEYYSGKWQQGNLQGYTSHGCGVSGLPVRYNCPGEIAIITLTKQV